MEFDFSTSEIRWNYNNENKIYFVEGVEFSLCENNIIYVEICKDTGYEYRYIDLNGKDIVWYTEQGLLSIFDAWGIKKKTIQLQKIYDVQIIDENIFVMYEEGKENKIKEYSNIGEPIREYISPPNYSFYRFAQCENEMIVVCQEDSSSEKYGRTDWKFRYNRSKEEWEKKTLTY